MIHTGDCVTVMRGMAEASVDAIVTDPPYGLEFMGKAWDKFDRNGPSSFEQTEKVPTQMLYSGKPGPDGRLRGRPGTPSPSTVYENKPRWSTMGNKALLAFQAWCTAWGAEALRVTKPGGYLLAFGGTRTHHRLVCGLEDAGWIIRDELTWVYASGFPKGKANLKPAHEPIVLARKPGPLRPLGIDACRIPSTDGFEDAWDKPISTHAGNVVLGNLSGTTERKRVDISANKPVGGRWPSNLLLSDPALFDEPNPEVVGSGATGTSTEWPTRSRESNDGQMFDAIHDAYTGGGYGDSGGYSRFFTLSVRMDGCQYCGAPAAESSSSGGAIPAIPSDSTPATVRTNGSAGTESPAPSAASGSSDSITPTAHQNARLWGDEGSASNSELQPMSGNASGSSSESEPTTKRTRRSKRPGTSPRSASPSGPATSAGAPATSFDTTTTTRSRWTCDACAALVTHGFTLVGMSTGPEDYREVPASRPDSPRYLIIPKADRADREPVLRGQLEKREQDAKYGSIQEWSSNPARENAHPTVKPVDLMRHLIRLVTPIGGTILDPFLGSGSTAIAAELEGFPWIGIEKEPEYVAIAEARLNGTQRGLGLDVPAPTRKGGRPTGMELGHHPDSYPRRAAKFQNAYRNAYREWWGEPEDDE